MVPTASLREEDGDGFGGRGSGEGPERGEESGRPTTETVPGEGSAELSENRADPRRSREEADRSVGFQPVPRGPGVTVAVQTPRTAPVLGGWEGTPRDLSHTLTRVEVRSPQLPLLVSTYAPPQTIQSPSSLSLTPPALHRESGPLSVSFKGPSTATLSHCVHWSPESLRRTFQ